MDSRLREWLLRREDGDLAPSELDELAELLSRDPEARRELLLHSMISSGIGHALAPRSTAVPDQPARPRRRLIFAAAAAAALLAICATVMLARKGSSPPPGQPETAAQRPAPPAPPKLPKPVETPKPVPEDPGPVDKARPEETKPPVPERPPIDPPASESPKPKEPLPPEKPEPRPASPEDADRKRAPVPAPTVTVLATLERVAGNVFIRSGAQKTPAKPAQGILAGQGLETEGPAAEAVVVYSDLTRLSFSADASVGEFSDPGGADGGKRLTLGRGMMAVDLAAQADAKPFIVRTPQAEIRGSSGYFVLSCDAEATRIDVGAGRIRLSRLLDGRSLEISGGQFAQVAPGSDFSVRPLLRQDKKKKTKKDLEFELKVNAAIRSGVAFLGEEAAQANLVANMPDASSGYPVELVLWALERGGLPESDPSFQKLFQFMVSTDLRFTYKVSLEAMVLEELDRVRYQSRIAHCAQFLVDNQARNGQWSYGESVPLPELTPTGAKGRKETATPGAGKPDAGRASDARERKDKPKVVQKIIVVKRRDGAPQGDNSNSQYAALGLRACFDSGIVLPADVLKRAQAWWREAQAATKKSDAAGWTYGEAPAPQGRTTYGSMTAGAAGSLVMYHYMLNEPWMRDEGVLKGLEWIGRNFTIAENPYPDEQGKKDERWHYYYLYALERLGVMYGADSFAGHDWYLEGANHLLKAQKPDGSWSPQPEASSRTVDTCFAILFLRRATRPLIDVASVDKNYPK
jgi:ferric-dicitrate binding protein FerR (iron transport regulator)